MTLAPIRYGAHGPIAYVVQRRLGALRYEITGADGERIGPETWRALARLGEDLGVEVPWADEWGGATLPAEVAAALEDEPEVECGPGACTDGPAWPEYDMRAERKPSAPKVRVRGGRVVERDLSKVDTLVLHQTAVELGAGPARLARAGGDRLLALAQRSTEVACHALATRDPMLAIAAPWSWHVNHANGYNDRSIGLEFSAAVPGLTDDPATLWCPRGRGTCEATPLDPATLELWGRMAIRVVDLANAAGCRITRYRAHRQSSATRRSDPGEAIWVPVSAALDAAGLTCDTAETLGTGRPIPAAWGGAGRY